MSFQFRDFQLTLLAQVALPFSSLELARLRHGDSAGALRGWAPAALSSLRRRQPLPRTELQSEWGLSARTAINLKRRGKKSEPTALEWDALMFNLNCRTDRLSDIFASVKHATPQTDMLNHIATLDPIIMHV